LTDPSTTELDHAARLKRMARAADYPLTLWLINPINRQLVRPLTRMGVSPNAVTGMSFVVGIFAAAAMAFAAMRTPWALVVAPVLVFVSHLLDALDGDLARYSDQKSLFGEMVDPALDRAREFAYVAGVTVGLAEIGNVAAWQAGLACLGATQLYYYTADAQIARLLKTKANELARYDVTLKGRGGTRMKLGLYEPFMYGLVGLLVIGFGFEALWFFAAAFGAGWVRQVFKMRKRAAAQEAATAAERAGEGAP
jgi:phosphatidylglycerophosphate synthase